MEGIERGEGPARVGGAGELRLEQAHADVLNVVGHTHVAVPSWCERPSRQDSERPSLLREKPNIYRQVGPLIVAEVRPATWPSWSLPS